MRDSIRVAKKGEAFLPRRRGYGENVSLARYGSRWRGETVEPRGKAFPLLI